MHNTYTAEEIASTWLGDIVPLLGGWCVLCVCIYIYMHAYIHTHPAGERASTWGNMV